jgi:hypothetical protein
MACVIEYPHGVGRCFIVAACLALFVLVVAQLVRGPVDSLGSAVFPTSRPGVKYGGRVEPGYEAVAEIFRLHFDQGVEAGAQCCAYVRGQKVVDLWGLRQGTMASDQCAPRRSRTWHGCSPPFTRDVRRAHL